MAELGVEKIKDILKDTKYENKFINSLFLKSEELQHTMHLTLSKKKKEIEGFLNT